MPDIIFVLIWCLITLVYGIYQYFRGYQSGQQHGIEVGYLSIQHLDLFAPGLPARKRMAAYLSAVKTILSREERRELESD